MILRCQEFVDDEMSEEGDAEVCGGEIINGECMCCGKIDGQYISENEWNCAPNAGDMYNVD